MTGWLIAILAAGGTILLGVVMGLVRADLEDAAVCRWLARKLVYRAALRLPRGERARWREESLQNALDLPGRLPPLLWALDVYVRSGHWGRMRGAPSRSQVLLARVRAAWQRLRTLPRAREAERLEREKALSRQVMAYSKQLHPSVRAAWAEPQRTTLFGTVGAGKTESLLLYVGAVPAREMWRPPYPRVSSRQRDGMTHLSDEEFTVWLSQQRQLFEAEVDRQVEQYRRGRRFPGRPAG